MAVVRSLRVQDRDAFARNGEMSLLQVLAVHQQHGVGKSAPPVRWVDPIDTWSAVPFCVAPARSTQHRRCENRSAADHQQRSETKQPPVALHDVAFRWFRYRVARVDEKTRHGGNPHRGARQQRLRTRREAPLRALGQEAIGERWSTVRSRRCCNWCPGPGSWECSSGCTPARETLTLPAPRY